MTLSPVNYDDRQHVGYARGRRMPHAARDLWMRTFTEHAPRQRPLHVLDLGSGVGRLTPALAQTFGSATGVEPSDRMRAVAEVEAAHPGVRYIAGRAEAIPLADDSVDIVLMMLSYQHVRDRAAAAGEIDRVLKPGGRVFIRGVFSDRMPDIDWHRYFPRARDIELAMFPTTAEVEDAFAPVGLKPVEMVRVREPMSASLAETAERLSHRAISTFEHLTEAEIEEGFARLSAAVAAEMTPVASYNDSDLMVLARV